MLRQYIAVLIMFWAISCADNSSERKDGYSDVAKSPDDSLFQEVMDAHDEAMPKSMRIPDYRKELKKKLDSLDKLKTQSVIDTRRKYQDLDNQLANAEAAMNAWMHEFKIDSADNNEELRLKYLSSEKAKVEKVRVEVLAAVAAADSLLK